MIEDFWYITIHGEYQVDWHLPFNTKEDAIAFAKKEIQKTKDEIVYEGIDNSLYNEGEYIIKTKAGEKRHSSEYEYTFCQRKNKEILNFRYAE